MNPNSTSEKADLLAVRESLVKAVADIDRRLGNMIGPDLSASDVARIADHQERIKARVISALTSSANYLKKQPWHRELFLNNALPMNLLQTALSNVPAKTLKAALADLEREGRVGIRHNYRSPEAVSGRGSTVVFLNRPEYAMPAGDDDLKLPPANMPA